MPHRQRFILEGLCYHTISVTHRRQPVFGEATNARFLVEALDFVREQGSIYLLAYAILPDHVHLLVAPRGDTSISDVMKSMKNFSARQINESNGRREPVWQRSFYDRVIRDETQLATAVEYIHANPVEAGLANIPSAYEFSSAHESARTNLGAFFGA